MSDADSVAAHPGGSGSADDERAAKLATIRLACSLAQDGDPSAARARLDPLLADADAIVAAQAQVESAALDLATLADARRAVRRVATAAAAIQPGSPEHARALLVLGIAFNRAGLGSRACAQLADAIRAYTGLGDVAGRAQAQDALGTALGWSGSIELATLHHSLALADWAALGERDEMAATLQRIGRLNLEARRHAHALEFLHRSSGLLAGRSPPIERLRARHLEGQALSGLGRHAEALALFDSILEATPAGDEDYVRFVAARDAALAAHRSGDAGASRRYLDEARRSQGDAADSYEAVSLRVVEAEILLDRGEIPPLAGLEEAAEWLASRDLAALEVDARLVLARALAASALPRNAERHLASALRKAQARGLGVHASEVRNAIAGLDLASGVLEEERRPVTTQGAGHVDGYVLRESLGKGGFGSVTRAFDLARAREVALKELRLLGIRAPAARNRILASARVEFEAAARVRHPGIARIYALNHLDDDRVLLVEEFIAGRTLRARMSDDAWPSPEHVLDTLIACAHALEALHATGVVHRDLKPANIVLRAEDDPVLIDFGLAQLRGKAGKAKLIVGTPAYMAPEQTLSAKVDARADLYSVGVILHEWLAGSLPIAMTGDTKEDVRALREREPEPLERLRPDLPAPLCDLVARLLSKRRSARPASAAELASRLEGIRGA